MRCVWGATGTSTRLGVSASTIERVAAGRWSKATVSVRELGTNWVYMLATLTVTSRMAAAAVVGDAP